MNKDKKTPADRAGGRRKPKPAPAAHEPSWSPLDDIYGDPHHPIDSDFGVDKGKYESPPPKPTR